MRRKGEHNSGRIVPPRSLISQEMGFLTEAVVRHEKHSRGYNEATSPGFI